MPSPNLVSPSAPPVFIVNSGRCGSTLLSNIINLHPNIVSLSEFFASIASRAFINSKPTGPTFWKMLNALTPLGRKYITRGLKFDEIIYEFGENKRFSPSNIPPLMCTTFPHLSKFPEKDFDELEKFITHLEVNDLAEQYRSLFGWFCEKYSGEIIVERTGASLIYTKMLADLFPDAKFIHLYRDGREVVLSMKEHHSFKMIAKAVSKLKKAGINPLKPPFLYGSSRVALTADYLIAWFSNVEKMALYPCPIEVIADFWNELILFGVGVLETINKDHVLDIKYENLVLHPRRELKRIADFLGPQFSNDQWLDLAEKLPKKVLLESDLLSECEKNHLTELCSPGLKKLGYI